MTLEGFFYTTMNNKGWIKLNRSLVDWQWYDDHNATRLLIHLLISVNFEEKKWRGITIKKGSMVLSWNTLSEGCGLSVRQCRTSMLKLIKSKEVTKQVTNRFQVVSLVKWKQFQLEDSTVDKQVDIQMTDNRQTDDRQVTTTKERKENKEHKEGKEDVFFTIDSNIENYLKNNKLVSAVIGNKKNKIKNKDHLKSRLEQFSQRLSETGVHTKTWNDFTSHFLNWNKKTPQFMKTSQNGQKDLTAGKELLNVQNQNK